MTNIYLTDSDKEAIMDFAKDHKESYNKTNEHFKDKTRKECLWQRFTNSHKLSVKVQKTWFTCQSTHYSKLAQSKSGQAPKEMTERQNWIQNKFNFLKMNIRCKELSKSSGFKSLAWGTSETGASAHDISRGSTKTDSLSMWSNTTIQPLVTNQSTVSGCFLVNQQIMDQFS